MHPSALTLSKAGVATGVAGVATGVAGVATGVAGVATAAAGSLALGIPTCVACEDGELTEATANHQRYRTLDSSNDVKRILLFFRKLGGSCRCGRVNLRLLFPRAHCVVYCTQPVCIAQIYTTIMRSPAFS